MTPSPSKFTSGNLREIARLIARYKWEFLLGLFFLIVVDAMQLYNPQIIQQTVNGLANGSATMATLWWAGLTYLGIQTTVGILRFGWRYYISGTSLKVERDLRAELYRHLQTLSLEYYDHTKVGTVMSYATNDVPSVRLATGMALLGIVDAAFMILTSTAIMFYINWELSCWILLPIPLLSLVMMVFGRRMHRQFLKVQDLFSKLSDRAQESFSAIRVVKAYGNEAMELMHFDACSRQVAKENLKLAKIEALFNPLIALLISSSLVILTLVGGRMAIRGEITVGEFVSMGFYLGLLIWPMMAIGWVVNLLQRGSASMQRLREVFDTKPGIIDGPLMRVENTALEIRDLTFAYPGTPRPVLQKISFTLRDGGTLGIVGATGSGKTTLVELIMRLYDPPKGTVFLGGRDITDLQISSLHGTIGYVPQESFLFAMSVAENIAFGNAGLGADEIEAAARKARIHQEIASFAEGYRTRVGERGVTLSGGQKQRIAIARALAGRHPLLIFDDCLSAVDTETEAAILRELKGEIEGRTSVLISHRISTVRNADLIIVLDNGKIAEMGTHEDLLLNHGYYTNLYRLQKLEDEARRRQADGSAGEGVAVHGS
jgi:ATP-binding cassette subfamily B protein